MPEGSIRVFRPTEGDAESGDSATQPRPGRRRRRRWLRPALMLGGVLALGLDRLGLTTDPQGRAAVEAGRYVATGLFLGVRQGAQGQTGVAVQLELTPRLRLEAQTATGPAGDRVGMSYELEY